MRECTPLSQLKMGGKFISKIFRKRSNNEGQTSAHEDDVSEEYCPSTRPDPEDVGTERTSSESSAFSLCQSLDMERPEQQLRNPTLPRRPRLVRTDSISKRTGLLTTRMMPPKVEVPVQPPSVPTKKFSGATLDSSSHHCPSLPSLLGDDASECSDDGFDYEPTPNVNKARAA